MRLLPPAIGPTSWVADWGEAVGASDRPPGRSRVAAPCSNVNAGGARFCTISWTSKNSFRKLAFIGMTSHWMTGCDSTYWTVGTTFLSAIAKQAPGPGWSVTQSIGCTPPEVPPPALTDPQSVTQLTPLPVITTCSGSVTGTGSPGGVKNRLMFASKTLALAGSVTSMPRATTSSTVSRRLDSVVVPTSPVSSAAAAAPEPSTTVAVTAAGV